MQYVLHLLQAKEFLSQATALEESFVSKISFDLIEGEQPVVIETREAIWTMECLNFRDENSTVEIGNFFVKATCVAEALRSMRNIEMEEDEEEITCIPSIVSLYSFLTQTSFPVLISCSETD